LLSTQPFSENQQIGGLAPTILSTILMLQSEQHLGVVGLC
jgi:hypothetical protein